MIPGRLLQGQCGAAFPALAFFVTEEEIIAARELIIAEELASEGISSISVDGMNVNVDRDAAKRRLELLDSLSVRNNAQPHRGLRFTKLVPPGCG